MKNIGRLFLRRKWGEKIILTFAGKRMEMTFHRERGNGVSVELIGDKEIKIDRVDLKYEIEPIEESFNK